MLRLGLIRTAWQGEGACFIREEGLGRMCVCVCVSTGDDVCVRAGDVCACCG